ncbi:MAG: Fe-S cluster assembly protein SufB, partial [bacterium]|nr:Fe-S cluster assembly protein SufB [bacterium]
MMATELTKTQPNELFEDYRYGFHDEGKPAFSTGKGLTREIVAQISEMKGEPGWMTDFRLRAYDIFVSKPMPAWGDQEALGEIDFEGIQYYVRASDAANAESWEDVPADVKRTFDRLGIPEAERKFLAGVSAQYDSEVVYHSIRKDLDKLGVIFCDMDTAVREHPEIVKKYFGT